MDAKLARTSSSFQAAVRQEFTSEKHWCDAGRYQIDVTWYWPDDQALGDSGGCGGAVRLWFRPSGGGWNHFDTQDAFSCRTLHRMGVPEPMTAAQGGDCYDDPQAQTHDYDPSASTTATQPTTSPGESCTVSRYQGDGSYVTTLCPDGRPNIRVEKDLLTAAPAIMRLDAGSTAADALTAGCQDLGTSNAIWVRLAYEYVRAREGWGSEHASVDAYASSLDTCGTGG